MKRYFALLLTLCLLAAALSGCGSQTVQTPAETEAVTETAAPLETESAEPAEEAEASDGEDEASDGEDEAAPAFNFEGAEQAYAPDTLVMNIGGTELDWSMYYASVNQVVYEINTYYGISDLSEEIQEGMTIADWVKGWTDDYLCQLAMLHNKAAELGVTLSEEDLAQIDEDIQTQADAYFDGDKDALFREMQITEELYRYQAEASLLYDKLFESHFGEGGAELSEEDAIAYAVDNGYLYAKHILWSFTDDEGNELSDEEKEAKRAQAREVLDELLATPVEERESAFDRMMEHYSDDPGKTAYPDGYYFQSGTMVAVFEEAAAALAVNELSELVESDYGIHILYRPPMRAEHLFEYGSDGESYTLRVMAADELFANMCEEWMEEQTVEYAPGFEELDLVELFAF